MPKIKSPISQTERDYNLRYERSEQIRRLELVRTASHFRFSGAYATTFVIDIEKKLQDGKELSERQADFLAELYDKYAE